ncbi:MAG: histidinol-phosphate transaminase [Capsulimonadaceae bacterium]
MNTIDGAAAVPLPPVGEHILGLKPYVPGKPIEQVQREIGLIDVIKLASNENPFGPSSAAIEAMRAASATTAMYPEGDAPVLRNAVAGFLDVPCDHLVFGNGSDEILHLLALTFLQPGDNTLQGDPSFAMYEIYARQCGADPIKVPLNNYTHDLPAMLNRLTSRTKVVFVANPNNPTGTLVTADEVDAFVRALPDTVVAVFDEAYHEYVANPAKPDTLQYVREGRNVVVLRTFSKAYGLAGLRVGYGIARPEIAALLNRVRSPFNVNLIAQAAATAALGDQYHIRRAVVFNEAGRQYFYDQCERLGLAFVPSQANFVLIDVNRDSRTVFEALQRRGVIIRPGAGLGLPSHIRVTVGTDPQNRRFVDALKAVLEDISPWKGREDQA